MGDDEDSLFYAKKTSEAEMENEKLEIAEIVVECESKTGFREPGQNEDGDRGRMVELEDKPVSVKGRVVGDLGNQITVEDPESNCEIVDTVGIPAVTETIEQPVEAQPIEDPGVSEPIEQRAVAEPVEQPVAVMFEQQSVWTEAPILALEEKSVIDAKEEGVVSDKRDLHVFAESREGTQEVDQLDGTMIEEKAEDEFAPSLDTEHERVFTDIGHTDLQTGTGVEEMLMDSQPELKTNEEFMPDTDSAVDTPIADVDTVKQIPELSPHGLGNEPHAARGGIDGWGCKSERNFAQMGKIGDLVGMNNGLADSWTVENDSNAVVEHDEVHEEKVDHLSLEIGSAEISTVFHEETVGPVITSEIPTTEENTCSFAVSDRMQIHMLSGGLNFSSEHVQAKEMDGNDGLVSGTMLEYEKSSVEALNAYSLDENVNPVETNEETAVKVETSSGNVKLETDSWIESETRDDPMLEEIQSADAEVGTDMGAKVVAREMQDEDSKMEIEETASDVDEPGLGIYDSPSALQDEEDETLAAEEETGTQDTEMETETDGTESGKSLVGKGKRGKFSKSPNSKAIAKSSSRKTIGEDVCFICFDGGELVLCDRRGCPKAYHPSCVNRDEAFFRSKGRWNCGWHLCSICEKNARYMCYTCTFSLCKSCIKDAVILCVRGNKGFCETCMRTVALIESNEPGSKDAQIDFDDKSSWEYLFKDYYTELKAKLSLSPLEISEAKNPWKGADMTGPSRQDSSEGHGDVNDAGSGSEDSAENLEPVTPKRRKVRKHSKSLSKEEESLRSAVTTGNRSILYDRSNWASKELLEFVLHMKNGDISVLSQFDVQALLLEYIKRNKLRDPRRKSQILCDARLQSLFGKPRVGHFEMLKLLESHFLVRDEQNDDVQGSVVDIENNQLDIDGNSDTVHKGVKDKKRKSRKKGEKPQSNLDDYAAIDMHNIGLIYLRRKLMEDLLEDAERFHERVIGTFVRIRISGSNQKQDLYRLVQVVGTSKAAEPYKIGKRTTETMVEILNLDKTEIISIDTISNQDFTEEECKRLRQSIKCGLINPVTVGVILDKTMELQAIKVNDWLESETMRLSHLRDRASDMGHRKELRECVEKLQLLKTPEERKRRLEEFPEIHSDPKMNPSHESEDNNDSETENSQRDAFMRSTGSGLSRRGRGPISPRGDNSTKDSWNGPGKVSAKPWESSRHLSSNLSINSSQLSEKVHENSLNLERDNGTHQSSILEKVNTAATSESTEGRLRSATRPESFSGGTSLTSEGSSSSEAAENTAKINESEKIWRYLDPSGKVQGPFSIVQLRKWNNTGYFPVDLKIWRATEMQDAAVLLVDALAGKFPKVLPAIDNMFSSTNPLQSSRTLASHSGWSSRTSLNHDKERSDADQHSRSSLSNLITERLVRNVAGSLPSPTPSKNNVNWSAGEGRNSGSIQSTTTNVLFPSTPILPNTGTQSSALASVLNSVIQNATFSPTSKSQPVVLGNSSVSLLSQTSSVSEPHSVQMPAQPPPATLPVQTVISQSLQADNQSWGASAQPVQPQGYSWGAPNVQNSSGSFPNGGTTSALQPDAWGSTQGSQPVIASTATQNASWGMGPAESSTMGVRPENSNAGWGQMQANPNMGWVNPAGNTNMNWAAPVQAPPPVNTPTGWVAPVGNPGASMQGMGPGNANPGTNIQGMAPGNVNHGANMQGMGPGNANPGTNIQGMTPGNVNHGANMQGMGPGNANPGTNIQGIAPGNVNHGANMQGMGPGNANPGTNIQGIAPGNVNHGANMQGMGPGNANPGTNIQGMAPGNVNHGANMQGMGPGNANPGTNIQGMAPGNVNHGANMQGMGPGNANPGWVPPQGWGAPPPVQGPVSTNGWGPPAGNAGSRPVQGPPQGSTNQNWVPLSGPQGTWSGEQNYGGGQFSAPRGGGQGRNSGYNGGRPWDRQSSFGGGGGSRPKRDTLCPYNANGRCRKGARCDYLHA